MSPEPAERRSPVTVGAGVAIVVGLLLLVVGFAMGDSRGSDQATPATASVTGSLPPVTASFAAGRTPLPGFGETAITVTAEDGTERTYCVLTALLEAQRERGLMAVTDPTLGGYGGMLFVFPHDQSGGFWMRNTPMPLSIAYLDGTGGLVKALDMTPCGDTPNCRIYTPGSRYRMALEVPQGRLERLGVVPGARVARTGACSPRS